MIKVCEADCTLTHLLTTLFEGEIVVVYNNDNIRTYDVVLHREIKYIKFNSLTLSLCDKTDVALKLPYNSFDEIKII